MAERDSSRNGVTAKLQSAKKDGQRPDSPSEAADHNQPHPTEAMGKIAGQRSNR